MGSGFNRDLRPRTVFGILVPFFILVALGIIYKTPIQDWWYFRTYEPSAQIITLATTADMSPKGEQLFYRADPELIDADEVDDLCLGADNLGCLVTGPKIYIVDYSSASTDRFNQAVVTGAHEMLHMAYFRLNDEEKEAIQRLIDQALLKVSNNRVFTILDKSQDDQEYYDEAYALLGTEVENLPLELEAHYRELFRSRDSVLQAFARSKNLL